MQNPEPVSKLDVSGIKCLFFDIDDTFSTNGKITSGAFEAAWKLFESGLTLVPLTGRPAGWCDHIARMWPVHAVIGENGAFYCMMKNGKMHKYYITETKDRHANIKKLEQIRKEILRAVPGAGIASDQPWREHDLAIDYCEDVPRLSQDKIERIVEIFKKHGANVKVSSIHVNGWFGDYDKLAAAELFAREELGLEIKTSNDSFAFIGDSPNDEPLFAFFENSVGVANVNEFKSFIKTGPAYITKAKSGDGFAELAAHILAGMKKEQNKSCS